MLKEYIKKYQKWSLVGSILMLILAIFLIAKPLDSLSVFIMVFGGILILDGIIHLIEYFKTEKQMRLMSFSLVEGILAVLAGVIIMITSETLTAFMPIMLAIWIIIKSLFNFQYAINLKTIPNSGWAWMLVLSILTLILGLVIIFNPFATAAIATTTVGIILLASEAINIIESVITLITLKK